MPPPRAPALPSEARAPHASSLTAAKRSKAKAKGKEVKKEVRLAVPWWGTVGGLSHAPVVRVGGSTCCSVFTLPVAVAQRGCR